MNTFNNDIFVARNEALERVEGLEKALRYIASQKLPEEIDLKDYETEPDYEGGYEAIVRIARAALAYKDRDNEQV